MAALKLKAVQLAPGVHIPGIASQTLTSAPGRSIDLDLEHGLIAVDTGKSEHLIPITSVVRIDPISEKYAPKVEPKPTPAPQAATPAPKPGSDTTTFVKDPTTGAIVEAPKKK